MFNFPSSFSFPAFNFNYKTPQLQLDIGPSEVRAIPLALQRNVVCTIFGIIFVFLSSFWVTYFSPRMGCPRVVKFCMDSKFTKI